jgi:two-component system chemotaxis response regulator CheB
MASEPAPERRDIVVIGASAGGVTALRSLVSQLPADFPAALMVALHVGAHPSVLPALLQSAGPLRASHAANGEPIIAGRIYVAPPDHHLVIEPQALHLTRGPKEHHSRPAIDPLFRSAALAYGPRVIGVVLTGQLDDGTAGLQAIKACGGLAIVQDPRDAEHPSMPMSALHHVDVDHCLPLEGIVRTLMQLVNETVARQARAVVPALLHEHALTATPSSGDAMEHLQAFAKPSSLVCPDCGGALWEAENTRPLRFRCHTGHAYTLRTLAHTMGQSTEYALQAAIRAMQEQAILLRKAAVLDRETGALEQAAAAEAGAELADSRTRMLRQLVEAPAVQLLEPGPAPTAVSPESPQ